VQATKVKVAMAENSTAVCWFFLIVQSNDMSAQLICTQSPLSNSKLSSRTVGGAGPGPLPGNIDNDMDVIIVPDINYVCAVRSFIVDSYCGCYSLDTSLTPQLDYSGSPGPVAVRAPTNSSFIYVLTRYPVSNLAVK